MTPDGAADRIADESRQNLASLIDGVQSAGTLDSLDVRVLGIPFQIHAYQDLMVALGVGGYRDSKSNVSGLNYGNQSDTSFQFAYDWRRDNVENARLLHRFVLEKKAYVENERRKRYGNNIDPVRFDIIAHSMGGLVARYYMQYGDADLPADGSTPTATWAGAEHVQRLVLIATPNAGSLDTIANFIHGERLSDFCPITRPRFWEPCRHCISCSSQPAESRDRRRRPRGVDIMDPQVWQEFWMGIARPSTACGPGKPASASRRSEPPAADRL